MRRRIVADHLQRPGVPLAQLLQEGRRGSPVVVALQFYPLHLPSLQAHRRIVAAFSPRLGLVESTRSCFPFSTHLPRSSASTGSAPRRLRISLPLHVAPPPSARRTPPRKPPVGLVYLGQTLLGAFEGESQLVQSLPSCRRGLVQTSAPAKAYAKPVPRQLMDCHPVLAGPDRYPPSRAILGPHPSIPPVVPRLRWIERAVC